MSNLRMKVKQGVAAFLAVCMMMPSFAGTAWADIDLDEEIKTEEHQIDLDLSALEQGIQEAVNTNQHWNADKMKFNSSDDDLITTYEQLFQDPDGTNPVYLVDYKFEDGALPAKSDMKIFVRTRPLERNLFEEKEESIEAWEKENGIETSTPSDATPSDAEPTDKEDEVKPKTASSSDADGYQITGEEEVTILFKNSSNKNYLVRITLGGYQFKIMDVPSASILIDEVRIDTPVEAPAPVESAPAEGGTPGEGGEVIETTEETQESLPEETSVEESSTEETSLSEETPTEESTTEESSSTQETSEATEETSAGVEETSATQETSATEETTEAAVTEAETEAKPEVAVEAETEAATEAVVSFSAHQVPRVAVPVAGDIDPADLDEDDPNYEEYIEEDDLEEDYEEEYEEVSARSMDEELGEVFAPVLYREQSTRSLRRAVQETTTASMVFALGDVRAVKAISPFNVTMYKYHTGKNGINESYSPNFKFGSGGNAQPSNYRKPGNNQPANITQGLVKQTFFGDHTNFIKHANNNIFPATQGGIHTNVMTVYDNVNLADEFFARDNDGYYTFNSKEMGARFDTGSKVLGLGGDSGEFYPFGKQKYSFGMHLSFDFSVLSDGKVNGKDMEFEFRGDDDTWIYLKDKTNGGINRLALDIGGIHGLMSGKMNFATGVIAYESNHASLNSEKDGAVIGQRYFGEGTKGSFQEYYSGKSNDAQKGSTNTEEGKKNYTAYLYTREDAIEQAMKSNVWTDRKEAEDYVDTAYFQFMGFDRKALGNYTLNFYILERGAGNSNCYLKFNIPTYSKDEIVVHKNVISSEEDEDKNQDFAFELWTGSNSSNLKKTEEFIINPSKNPSWKSGEKYLPGTYFQVKEVDKKGALKVNWQSGSGIESIGNTEAEVNTEVFRLGEENVVLFTNLFDMFPTVGKRALLQANKEAQYDIELLVGGETLTEEKIDGESKTYYLKNVVATDTLSQHVEFLKEGKHPQLTLVEGENETPLTTTDGKTYKRDNQTIAQISDKTITWYVTAKDETFAKTDRRILRFPVTVSGETLAQYPNQGDPNTGTHANSDGYFSNSTAYVTANNTAGTRETILPFPKPVVRPVNFMGLELEKQVVGAQTGIKFPFDVEFKDGGNDITFGNGVEKVGDTTFKVTGLGDGGSVKFKNIQPNATYTITESTGEDDYYTSECIKIETGDIVDGKFVNPIIVETPTEKKTTGTLSTDKKVIFTNTLTPKTMGIEIVKQLVAADMEETTFVFKVENQDENSPGFEQVFYTSITVPAGDEQNSVTLSKVPMIAGEGYYQVTEEQHMRYEQTEVTNDSKITAANPTVMFTNKKDSDSYFSSTHVAVNKVVKNEEGNFGFQETYPGRQPIASTETPEQLAAILPEDSQKRLDEEDSSDIDKTV